MMRKIQKIFIKNFSLDSRSLSFFRVGIGLTFLIDYLFTRIPYADLFYFRGGISSTNSHASSLAFIHSADWFQLLLLLSTILCFCLFIVGYKTRYTSFIAWILLISIHTKNDMIVNSGDILGYLLLFWALPLPLNKHFSIDSALKEQKPTEHFSLFSIFFIGQILLVYWMTFLLKNHPVWQNGDAIYYAMMLDNFRTYWGDILLQYPYLMKILTHITYYFIEGSVPLILLFAGFIPQLRIFLIFLMLTFHISLNLTMHLGMFSYFSVLMWCALLPSEFWNYLKKYIPKKSLHVYFDDKCFFCKKSTYLLKTFLILPHIKLMPGQSNPSALSEMEKRNSWVVWDEDKAWQSHFSAFVELVSLSPLFFYLAPILRLKWISSLGNKVYGVVSKKRNNLNLSIPEDVPFFQKRKWIFSLFMFYSFCFLYVILWNVRTLNFKHYEKYFPRKYNEPGYFLHIAQYWSMFAPYPMKKGGYIILSATRKDDTKIDLWRNGAPVRITPQAPYRYDKTFPVFRFRKMIENIIHKKNNPEIRKTYLRYLCRKWNKKLKENPIKRIELIYMSTVTPELGKPKAPAKQQSIASIKCLPPKNIKK